MAPLATVTAVVSLNVPDTVKVPALTVVGAETAIWLALRDFDFAKDKTGLLWEDRQIVEW